MHRIRSSPLNFLVWGPVSQPYTGVWRNPVIQQSSADQLIHQMTTNWPADPPDQETKDLNGLTEWVNSSNLAKKNTLIDVACFFFQHLTFRCFHAEKLDFLASKNEISPISGSQPPTPDAAPRCPVANCRPRHRWLLKTSRKCCKSNQEMHCQHRCLKQMIDYSNKMYLLLVGVPIFHHQPPAPETNSWWFLMRTPGLRAWRKWWIEEPGELPKNPTCFLDISSSGTLLSFSFQSEKMSISHTHGSFQR